MSGQPVLLVLGNACADRTFHLAALPRLGETVLARSVSDDLGGKGLNQAVAAARAGASVRFVGAVGTDDVADGIVAMLRREGIGEDGLIWSAGPSDSSIILLDATAENAIVSDTRQAGALDAGDAVGRLRLGAGDLLLLQGNLSEATSRAAIAAARSAGATVALNAAPMRDWLPGLAPDILIANRGEAAALAGMPGLTAPEAILARLDAPMVVITLGAQGCLLRTASGTWHLPAPSVAVRDTAGAGDVFCGVFCAEWLATGDCHASAGLALLAASATVTRPGTLSAVPTRAELDRLREAPPTRISSP